MVAVRHQPITPDDARAARERIAGAGAIRTPLVRLNADAPADIHLKLESLQPIGSFKIRGMANAIALADRDDLTRGVWTISAGNAGQGVAWCARQRGIPCTVVVPDNAPLAKLSALEGLGGKIIKVSFEEWLELANTRMFEGLDGVFVHPFSDPAVMAGNGTIALEILEDLPDVEAILVPWGGGGLCCGIAAVVRGLAPHVKVYACEFSPTAPLKASLDAGRPTQVPYETTFVDGIGAPVVFPEMFELARDLIEDSLVCPLEQVEAALRLVVARNHVVIEGAGAVPIAAALSGEAGSGSIACVASGGNIDLGKLAGFLGA